MRKALEVYLKLVSASVRSRMEYKVDFLGSTLILTLSGVYEYLLAAAIAWRFRSICGWDLWEIGLLFGITRIGYGIYRTLASEIEAFESYIVTGEFDSILTRPWPALFTLLARKVDLSRVGWFVQGLLVSGACTTYLFGAGRLNLTSVPALMMSVICTGVIFFSLSLLTASCAFWIVRIEELQVFTINAPGSAALYPLEAYPDWLKRLLLSVLPIAAGSYLPVRWVLGKSRSHLDLVLPVVVTSGFLALSLLAWSQGVKHYHSTGS